MCCFDDVIFLGFFMIPVVFHRRLHQTLSTDFSGERSSPVGAGEVNSVIPGLMVQVIKCRHVWWLLSSAV